MHERRDIVVIAASVGGIDALSRLTSPLPASLPASLLVVIHTSASSPRLLAQIIGRSTDLNVSYAFEGTPIKHGHVYIAPPEAHLMIREAGFLHLDRGPPEHFHRPAANVLFRSAAKIYGPRVIGMVLTGGDADGTLGCEAIKAAGGIVVVQEPTEAKNPGMPLSAIRSDHPDYKSCLNNIGALLVRLIEGEVLASRSVAPCL